LHALQGGNRIVELIRRDRRARSGDCLVPPRRLYGSELLLFEPALCGEIGDLGSEPGFLVGKSKGK